MQSMAWIRGRPLRKFANLGICLLFILLTVIYFRNIIFAPVGEIVTRHLATDIWGHFQNIYDSANYLRQGILSAGDYWVQHGGGYPSAFNTQFFYMPDLIMLPFYLLTGNFSFSLKILYIGSTLATLWLAYKYGLMLIKNRGAAVVVAVAYTFSLYGINQLEHPDLFIAKAFVVLAFILLEKVLENGRGKWVLLFGASLLLLWLVSPYPLYFALLYVTFRLAFHLIVRRTFKPVLNVLYGGIFFVLLALPFILLTTSKHPSPTYIAQQLIGGLGVYAVQPARLFYRQTSFIPYSAEIHFFYCGLSVLALGMLPMLKTPKVAGKWYIFALAIFIFCVMYSAVQYGPNIAGLLTRVIPFSYFIRVSGRIMIVGYLFLAVCAGIGYSLFRQKSLLVLLLVVAVIFADLTIGYEPSVKSNIKDLPYGAYAFVKSDGDTFRFIDFPSVNGQESLAYMETGKDVITSTMWASGLYAPLENFADLYYQLQSMSVTSDALKVAGVKYIVINTSHNYLNNIADAIPGGWTYMQTDMVSDWLWMQGYEVAYQDSTSVVYSNPAYAGMAYALDGTPIALSMGFNKVVITAEHPTDIILSQSYDAGWQADGGVIRQHGAVDKISMSGDVVILTYTKYANWYRILGASWLAALAVAVVLLRRHPYESPYRAQANGTLRRGGIGDSAASKLPSATLASSEDSNDRYGISS